MIKHPATVAALVLLAAASCRCMTFEVVASDTDVAASSPVEAQHFKPGKPGRPGKPNSFCSCAAPTPIPLNNGVTPYTSTWFDSSTQGRWYRPKPPVKYGLCSILPNVNAGGACGAGIGICNKGLCCGANGFCSSDPASCDGTCQCAYSGVDSRCRGSFPFQEPKASSLPVARPGGVCGSYVATCPRGQCCSQFNLCMTDGSPYCRTAGSCLPRMSPKSKTCSSDRLKKWHIDWQQPSVVRKDWVVSWKELALDGFSKQVIVVNGQAFPTLEASVGDRIVIKLTNGLNETTSIHWHQSIHWHGMRQYKTNIMDGVPAVVQRPILPGESHIYNFIADAEGTYWWHSHSSTQYMDGLSGVFVIRDPTFKKFAADEVVSMNDWYHEPSTVLLAQYLSPGSNGDEPTPYTSLTNGLGQGYCKVANVTGCSYSWVKGVASTMDNPQTKLRLVNMGGFAVFNVSIDNHMLIVVAEDGVQIKPVVVGSLQINNGQRYDVLPVQDLPPGQVPSQAPVWIRTTMQDDFFPTPSEWNTSLAVLYFTNKDQLPTTVPNFQAPKLDPNEIGPGVINPYSLELLYDLMAPPATKTLRFKLAFDNIPDVENATQYANMNLISLDMSPESPSLLERLSNNPTNTAPPTNAVPGTKGWHVVDVRLGDVVDVIIDNLDNGEHPLHLHGHWFNVLAAGLPDEGVYTGQRPTTGKLWRDTVTVNANSYVVLRYIAVNPGAWIFHCHIDWHLAAGLGLIFREGFPV